MLSFCFSEQFGSSEPRTRPTRPGAFTFAHRLRAKGFRGRAESSCKTGGSSKAGGQLLKDTILAVLNAEAVTLGAGPVTDRALEDWIFEDLFEGPTVRGLAGGGSERRYNPASLRAALEVVKLKASNPDRRNAL